MNVTVPKGLVHKEKCCVLKAKIGGVHTVSTVQQVCAHWQQAARQHWALRVREHPHLQCGSTLLHPCLACNHVWLHPCLVCNHVWLHPCLACNHVWHARLCCAERLAARQGRAGAPAAGAAGGAKGDEEDEADMAEQRELEGEALQCAMMIEPRGLEGEAAITVCTCDN
eukprot:1160403-Pelagomonas_calceolata.AAC.14